MGGVQSYTENFWLHEGLALSSHSVQRSAGFLTKHLREVFHLTFSFLCDWTSFPIRFSKFPSLILQPQSFRPVLKVRKLSYRKYWEYFSSSRFPRRKMATHVTPWTRQKSWLKSFVEVWKSYFGHLYSSCLCDSCSFSSFPSQTVRNKCKFIDGQNV